MSSVCSLPNTEFCVTAFSRSAFPYEKYKSAVSGAFSPSCSVLMEKNRKVLIIGRGVRRETNHRRDLHQFQCSGIMFYSLFILFKSKCAFGLFNGALDSVRRPSFWRLCRFFWLIASNAWWVYWMRLKILQYLRMHDGREEGS